MHKIMVLLALSGVLVAGPTAMVTAAPGGLPVALLWHGCQTGPDDEIGAAMDAAGSQCTEIRVPLDYRHPHGRTIAIAVSRLPAHDPAHRRGTLLFNPGGPGDPAFGLSLGFAAGAPDLAAAYDLVDVDPRFVGRSAGSACRWTTDNSLRGAGPTRRTFEESVAFAKSLADGCASDILPFASTRNTVRDLDAVRAALGVSKVSYVGWSYGSYLGAVYMQMFPNRVDRFVLDSAVDPDAYGPRLTRTMGAATEAALRHWAAWAAARDGTYHLGRSPDAVLATVQRAATRTPYRVGTYTVDSHIFPLLLFIPIRNDSDESYASIAADVRVLTDASAGKTVEPTPTLATNLASTATPGRDGTFILCADRAASRDPDVYYRDIQAHRADEPLFGPLTRNITPCAFWPAAPLEPPTHVRNGVPALIVGATGDPRTPYPGQLAMHRDLTGSRLVTLEGAFEHIVYAVDDVPCVTDTVNAYLLGGPLPAADATCRR
jgi:pimeloyl-ACP methyl ester carboxylesterase